MCSCSCFSCLRLSVGRPPMLFKLLYLENDTAFNACRTLHLSTCQLQHANGNGGIDQIPKLTSGSPLSCANTCRLYFCGAHPCSRSEPSNKPLDGCINSPKHTPHDMSSTSFPKMQGLSLATETKPKMGNSKTAHRFDRSRLVVHPVLPHAPARPLHPGAAAKLHAIRKRRLEGPHRLTAKREAGTRTG